MAKLMAPRKQGPDFQTLGQIGGAIVGGFAGGPAGIMTGANIGGTIGGALSGKGISVPQAAQAISAVAPSAVPGAAAVHAARDVAPEIHDDPMLRKMQAPAYQVQQSMAALQNLPDDQQELYRPVLQNAYMRALKYPGGIA